MSTKFGVFKLDYEFALENDSLPEGFEDEDFFVVAVRRNGGELYWHHSISDVADKLFDDNVLVYPLNNSAQGIFTIGHIKREMRKQNMQNERK